MEEALQQNETVNIFQDAFKLLGDEDTHVGKKGENELKASRGKGCELLLTRLRILTHTSDGRSCVRSPACYTPRTGPWRPLTGTPRRRA
jgi:hypothetical protein